MERERDRRDVPVLAAIEQPDRSRVTLGELGTLESAAFVDSGAGGVSVEQMV